MESRSTSTVRPIRNRRINRRSWSPLNGFHNKFTKKLFTPDIKRKLKQWLVERRENPYPTRGEKKDLADSTGLTYTQICNWFANWRRKLKNSGHDNMEEEEEKSWDHLIQSYNTHAKGNVEQLPLTDDEEEDNFSDGEFIMLQSKAENDHNNNNSADLNNNRENEETVVAKNPSEDDQLEREVFSQKKYKKSMMEKYFQGVGSHPMPFRKDDHEQPQLMKWIESTAKFTPDKFNYAAWEMDKMPSRGAGAGSCGGAGRPLMAHSNAFRHQFEELEAAEALTRLACN